jgi:ubiquinone biosynthesis protein
VAVKVMRPGVRDRFNRDIQAMRAAARLVERLSPDARRLKPGEVVETLARSVTMEMDLRLEAAAVSELAENTKDDPGFRVPKPYWDLTARDVLTTEWIDGIRMNDLAAIEAAGHDRVALGQTVIQSFLRHAIRDGFFHADMHPGNLFVDREGRLVAVDFGIMGRLGMKERRFLAEILLGFIRAIICASRRCISKPATCRRTMRWRISRRRSAPSASRSTTGAPTRSPWRSCSRFSSR